MATPSTQPTTPNVVPGSGGDHWFGGAPSGLSISAGLNDMLHDIAQAWLLLGNTVDGDTPLGYVRLHDGTSKGLLVPLTAIAGPGILINSNFDLWQQGSSGGSHTTTYNTITSYLPDQMFCLPGGATVTSARSTSVPDAKSRYSWQITGAASVTTVDVGQRLRSQVVNSRCLGSLVFSCYVFNGTGGAFTPNLRIGTPSSVDSFGTVTNRLDQALQSCANNAWTRVHFVFDPTGYTNVGNGLEVCLRVPTGVLVATKTANVAQFDLRPGTQYQAFLPPDPDLELRRALTFYELYGGQNVFEAIASGLAFSTTQAQIVLPFSPKWAAPTPSVSANGDFAVVNGSGTGIACTNITSAGGGLSRIFLTATVASGLTVGQATYMQANNTGNARLHLNSRL